MALFSIEELGLGVLFVLAFANGANDTGKSIVSLMTSREHVHRLLLWGGLFSGLGSASALLIAGRLFSVFTPQSLLNAPPPASFVLAALVGATLLVLGATFLRRSVSTTHAILGAIIVQAVFFFGVSSLAWDFLAWRVLLPLAGGPIAALIGTYLLSRVIHRREQATVSKTPSRLSGSAHWFSSGAAAFARGVNDAPKMAALGAFVLLARPQYSGWLPYAVVTVAVFVGAQILGHRVALAIAGHQAPLSHEQRFQAGVATAALVSFGAIFGAPLSTTHVSEGSYAGIGGGERSIVRAALKSMVLAWLVTMPFAGFLAILASIYGPKLWS